MNWTMAKAKEDFKRGFLVGLSLEYSLVGGWMIELTSSVDSDGKGYLVDARLKTPRVFKSLDTANTAIHQIGFKPVVFQAKFK